MAEQREMEAMESQETENMEPEETKESAGNSKEECGTDGPPETEETERPEESSSEEEESGEEEPSGEEQPSGENQGEEKKGFFKKKEKKNKQEEKIAELTDRVQRQMAEFDNFRKRTEKEKAQMFEVGAKSVIEKILPVVDNFERGLSAVPEESKGDPFVQGMDKIYKQLMTELESLEVKPIEAVGAEFNPEFHNAVMQVESEEYESGIVAQELQKGYMYRESVVRHSMVAVVQ
ncbi:nucleotide exchange factor GrpE [Petralouisia muris]|nr:nucleotide exchange factor GrpE [Petralouisia muris]